MAEDRSDLSVAVRQSESIVQPSAMLAPGHPEECTCGDKADVQVLLGGGMTLEDLYQLCKDFVTVVENEMVKDPITGKFH